MSIGELLKVSGTALLAVAFLTGCASESSYLSAHSASFVSGYKDGCESAKRYFENSLIEVEKPPVYSENEEYRKGWDDGYERCYSYEEMEIDLSRPAIFGALR
ncbi:hypothetical protein NNO_0890 [Hydrogenimonas sp.]|nr:hypothetical protein NNO_0890 [Hydrogenimonas sp.]